MNRLDLVAQLAEHRANFICLLQVSVMFICLLQVSVMFICLLQVSVITLSAYYKSLSCFTLFVLCTDDVTAVCKFRFL